MSAIDKIKKLYAQIPSFECKPGCTDCCGPVPFAKSEWNQIIDKREPSIINLLKCPYSYNGSCDIYNQRPFMCRIFGASNDPKLKCPHGCGPKQPLKKKKAIRLTLQYQELVHKD